MKKLISIIISIILFTSTILFILINAISLYFSEENIKNIIESTNFEQLVDLKVKDKNNYLLITINEMYKEQQKLGFNTKEITKLLNSKELKNNILNIATSEIEYIFTGNYNHIDIKFTKSQNKLQKYLEENTYRFDIFKETLHKSISKIINHKENLIHSLNSDITKIILANIIIILTLLLFVINNKKALNYIPVTFFLISVSTTIISIFTPLILNNVFNEYTLYILLKKSIYNTFTNFLLISMIFIVLTVIFIMISDCIVNKKKKHLRPKIISRYSDKFF